jgi:hypothetical protein
MDKRRLAADLDHHLERMRVALLDGTTVRHRSRESISRRPTAS